jgi:hypothetical protein
VLTQEGDDARNDGAIGATEAHSGAIAERLPDELEPAGARAGGRQRAHQSGEIAPTSGARDGSDGGNRADKQQGGGDRANASGGRREALAAPADGARPHMKEDKLKRTHHARSE